MAIVKPVSFKNTEKELVDYIGKRDFSYYVKMLIRKDMEANEIEHIKKANINFNF